MQWRDKRRLTTAQRLEIAAGVARALEESATALVVNDRVDIAAAVAARGVHLGPHDLDPAAARRLLRFPELTRAIVPAQGFSLLAFLLLSLGASLGLLLAGRRLE